MGKAGFLREDTTNMDLSELFQQERFSIKIFKSEINDVSLWLRGFRERSEDLRQ